MGGVQSIRDLNAQIQHGFNFQRLAEDQVLERLPLQQFHADEGSSFKFVDFVDRANVRVVQGGGGTRFPPKTLQRLRVVGEFVRKKLQSDMTAQLEVFCLIHHTHAPAPDLAEYAVMGNRLPHGLGGRGHWREC